MGFRITELSRPAIDGPSVLGSRDRPATPIPYHYRSTSLRMCVDGLQDWRLLGTAHEASSYPHVSLVSVFMHRTLPSWEVHHRYFMVLTLALASEQLVSLAAKKPSRRWTPV